MRFCRPKSARVAAADEPRWARPSQHRACVEMTPESIPITLYRHPGGRSGRRGLQPVRSRLADQLRDVPIDRVLPPRPIGAVRRRRSRPRGSEPLRANGAVGSQRWLRACPHLTPAISRSRLAATVRYRTSSNGTLRGLDSATPLNHARSSRSADQLPQSRRGVSLAKPPAPRATRARTQVLSSDHSLRRPRW